MSKEKYFIYNIEFFALSFVTEEQLIDKNCRIKKIVSTKLRKDGYVSMGCAVLFDFCELCNKNHNYNDNFCEHIK